MFQLPLAHIIEQHNVDIGNFQNIVELVIDVVNLGSTLDPVVSVTDLACAGIELDCANDGLTGEDEHLELLDVSPGTYHEERANANGQDRQNGHQALAEEPQAMAANWVEVCDVEDLDEEDVIGFGHSGKKYAVYRLEGDQFYASDGLCTHERYHLNNQWVSLSIAKIWPRKKRPTII